MDVLRLNPVTFLPDMLIEGYTSMVWTERYLGNGEFELVTGLVFETLDALPEGSLIGVRDSTEVMIVDSRLIEVDEEGLMSLKVVGRSFETFFENRVIFPIVYSKMWKVYQPYSMQTMICMLLWNYMVNTTLEDPMKPAGNYIDELQSVPNVVVTDSTGLSETTLVWWMEAGIVQDKLNDFLALNKLGLRTIRPNYTTGTVVTFSTATTTARGTVTKTVTPNIKDLRLDVYQGTDRSHLQSALPAVIFHYDSGHVDSPSYLFSNQEYKNMAVITSSIGTQEVWREGASTADKQASGMNRRALYLDGGTKEASITDADFQAALTQQGQVELQKHALVRLFDGEISPVAPYEFGKDYFLGDLVTVLARFGFREIMIVNEYVRTEDSEGDRGYPGLLALAD